jgi:hypothetical protein
MQRSPMMRNNIFRAVSAFNASQRCGFRKGNGLQGFNWFYPPLGTK